MEKERLEVRSQANLAIATGPALKGENERSVCPGHGADHHYILEYLYMEAGLSSS
jgi:hypothetical protein